MTEGYWKQFEGRMIENTFALRRLLGKGGFGCVFLADHIVKDEFISQVAVKLIMSEADGTRHQLKELVSARNLQHPSLLSCDHVGATTLANVEFLYLVMKLAQEGLDTRLNNAGFLPAPVVLEVANSLARGLAYLHEEKHVHRDVKPANVLRVGNTWRLSDFGTIRQSSDADNLTSVVIGTRDYMPPESFDGIVTPAWDIWSLGVLILRALTGRSPYSEASGQQLVRAILNNEPNVPANLPAPFGDIVRGCLVRDYRKRCSAEQVIAMLERGGGRPQTGTGETTMAGVPRADPRRLTLAMMALRTVGFFLLGAVVVLLFFSPRAPAPPFTGTFSGIVRNDTAGAALFSTAIREENGVVLGCIAVQEPLYGSGELKGTVDGSHASFESIGDHLGTRFAIKFDGDLLDGVFKGTYAVSSPTQQSGEFELTKRSSEAPRAGFNVTDCINTLCSKSPLLDDRKACGT